MAYYQEIANLIVPYMSTFLCTVNTVHAVCEGPLTRYDNHEVAKKVLALTAPAASVH